MAAASVDVDCSGGGAGETTRDALGSGCRRDVAVAAYGLRETVAADRLGPRQIEMAAASVNCCGGTLLVKETTPQAFVMQPPACQEDPRFCRGCIARHRQLHPLRRAAHISNRKICF